MDLEAWEESSYIGEIIYIEQSDEKLSRSQIMSQVIIDS
jgi:hypothetical protein